MANEYYILAAYPFIVSYEDRDITLIRVNEVNLSRLLRLLSIHDLPHAKPQRDPNSTNYLVYVLGDITSIGDELRGLHVETESKLISELSEAGLLINSAGYFALRRYLYNSGYKRGASSKLYNPNNVVYSSNNQVLNVYKAVVTGLDRLEDTEHLFIDAARKLEFNMSLQELEAIGLLGEGTTSVNWLKIIGTPTSFYVEYSLGVNSLLRQGYGDKLLEHTRKLVNYLVDTGRADEKLVGEKFNLEELSVEDLFGYALIPRSVKLKRELHGQGLLMRDPEKNIEALFLPKFILVPVASLDNVQRILPGEIESITEELRIPPGKRYSEIESFVRSLGEELQAEGLHIMIEQEPSRIPSVGKAKLSYIDGENGTEYYSKYPYDIASWDYSEKIMGRANEIKILILIIGKFDDETKSVIEQLIRNYGVEVELKELPDTASFKKNLNAIITELKNCKKRYRGLIVIGPQGIDEDEDDKIRRLVEFTALSREVFCRYLSRVSKGNTRQNLPYKLRTVLRSFAVFVLGELSHKLKPLEIWDRDRKKHSINTVIGIDATVIDMEKGTYRVACAVTMINLLNGEYKIIPHSELSDEGEDSTIAKILESLFKHELGNTKVLVYVNRARPEASILTHLSSESAKVILDNSIIVGATKTHSYSRIFKAKIVGRNTKIVNPERWIYIPLYKNQESKFKDLKISVSRYLISTVKPPGKKEFDLTLRPILLSILYGDQFVRSPKLDEKIIDYTASLTALNNVSTAWPQSLPWPLHIVDRKLKRAHELAPKGEKNVILQLLQNENAFRVL
jgi:hypothetical protein